MIYNNIFNITNHHAKTSYCFSAPHPLLKGDVFVFSGHTCGTFSCFFIQTVFFSRATLLQQFPDLKRSRNRELINTQHRPYFCT